MTPDIRIFLIGLWGNIESAAQALFLFVSPHLETAKEYLRAEYGDPGVYAAAALGIVLIALLIGSVLRIAASVVWYVAIPSAVISFLLNALTPFGFAQTLPLTVGLCAIILFFKS